MLDAGTIGYDLSILAKNVSTLQQHAEGMPEADVVKTVKGGGEHPAQESYTFRLRQVMGVLAARIENVRSFVANNADALNTAAAALEATDADGDQAAAEAKSFIESIVASTPSGTGTGTGTQNGTSPGSSRDSGTGADGDSGL